MTASQILLLDLEPHWLTPNYLAFLCPHCREDWLTVKDVVMTTKQQRLILEEKFGLYWNYLVVMANPDKVWTFSSRNFADMTIEPSVDASRAKHWHGHIQSGKIVGGL